VTRPLAFCAALCAALLFTPRARAQDLYVGSNSSGVTTNFTSGTNAYVNTYIGLNPGANANTLNVLNTNTLLTNSGNVYVGDAGMSNRLTVADGGSVSAAALLSVGNIGNGNSVVITNGGRITSASGEIGIQSSNNSVLVTGSNSVWTNSGSLAVGIYPSSSNSLVISNAGTVANNIGYIGFANRASKNSVLVTETNSLWTNSSDLYVGYEGSGNSLVISNAGTVANTDGYVGGRASSSNNSVVVIGDGSQLDVIGEGSLWQNRGRFYVGYEGSGNSLVLSNGGTVASGVGSRSDNLGTGYIGFTNTSSNNSVLVTGTNSLFRIINSYLHVGYEGSGNSLIISNGGKVIGDAGVVIGTLDSSSNNSVLVTGSNSLLADIGVGVNTVGNAGSGHSLTVADGGTVDLGYIYVGSSGTLNIGRFGTNDAAGTITTFFIDFRDGTGAINFNQRDATTNTVAIRGAGTINQLGAGTTTLSGSNTYSGVTTVGAGALLVNGDQSGATNNVLVASSSKFGGRGSIGGDTYIAGTHSPGNSPGVQTFLADLTYSNTAVFLWELTQNADATAQRGIAFDGVDVQGTLTIEAGAGSTLVFDAAGSAVDWDDAFWGSDRVWLVFSNINAPTLGASEVFSVSSTYLDSNANALVAQRPGAAFTWSTTANDVYLNYQSVPEPSTYALVLLAAGAALLWQRRRRPLA
jgi:T5SS/PEP-CTERM-associated repeat protein